MSVAVAHGFAVPRKPDQAFVDAVLEKSRMEGRQRLDRALPWRRPRAEAARSNA